MESIPGVFMTSWSLTTVQLLDTNTQNKAHEVEWRKMQKIAHTQLLENFTFS